MANLNDNIDKAKGIITDTAKKAKESETYAKVKSTANEVTEKIKDNPNVANAVEKINQNEYVQKVNKSKYSKFIKIGAVIVAIILIVNVFGWIFGDKKAKKAQDFIVSEITTMLKNEDATNCKVNATAIGKNSDASLYAFDTTVSCKYAGEDFDYSAFYILYYDSDDVENSYIFKEYEYQDENKRDMRDIALASLSKG